MKSRLFILSLIFTALVALCIFVYLPGYSQYQGISLKEDELRCEIEEFKKINQDLEDELTLLRTDISYLEKVVRDRMGLVKPGEELYKFVEEEMPIEE